jgi:hypothetical protein
MPQDMVSLGINSPYELTYDTNDLEDGLHTIYVSSIDFTGQESNRECDVFVDNSGPDIIIVEPTPKHVATGNTWFIVNVSDESDIDSVLIKIDNRDWEHMKYNNYSGNYTYAWLTSENDNRRHDYQIKTIDSLGNEEIIRSDLKVENPMNLWRAFQENLPGIGFLFLIFFIVLVFVLLKVGKLQSWYREEKPTPKAHAKGAKKGRFKRVFSRKKKSAAKKPEVVFSESAEEIVHEFEDIDKHHVPAVSAKHVPPPPPPPGVRGKSLVESLDDIEISDGVPPAPSETTDIPPRATSTMVEMEALTTEEPKTTSDAETKKVFKKKAKKKLLKKKKK